MPNEELWGNAALLDYVASFFRLATPAIPATPIASNDQPPGSGTICTSPSAARASGAQ